MKGRVLVAIQFGSLGALWLTPSGWGFVSPGPDALAALLVAAVGPLSTLLLAAAGALLAAAYLSLRPAFRVLPEPAPDAPFVASGIYRFIRHPMYTAVIAVGLSMALTRSPLLAWPLFVVLVVDLWVKSRYEDDLLRARHPQAADYQLRVGRFLPKFRRS